MNTADRRASTLARFWSKVNPCGPAHPTLGECWLWAVPTRPDGYGQFSIGRSTAYAHRFAYEAAVGPIPPGMELDHLCRVRHCVNPAHLEPVTPRENVMRGQTPAAKNAAKTRCPAGHEYTAENTIVFRRERSCRACVNGRKRERRALLRAAST